MIDRRLESVLSPTMETRLKYLAAAFDYDGTLATDGRVFPSTVAALRRLKESGRCLIMVTGRELEDLFRIFPEAEMFDLLVVENGALVYDPETKEERKLTEDASLALVEELRKRNVEPIHCGRCIISTWEPHHQSTIDAIRELGLELQILFNKGSVMVLPSGVNKGTGLQAALAQLGLSTRNVIGAGDAENDHALLSLCQVAVAPSNSLPAIKERADINTKGDHGEGIEEMIEMLLEDEFASLKLTRHNLLLGKDLDEQDVVYEPLGTNILIAGPSGGGKSTAALGILDTLSQADYQFCLIDPEGDYQAFDEAIVLGDTKRVPSTDEVLQLFATPDRSAVVNLLGMPLESRPPFFSALLSRLQDMRAEFGRPHWLVINEAHHLLPKDWQTAPTIVPAELDGLLLISTQPHMVSQEILKDMDLVLAIGNEPEKTIGEFAVLADHKSPALKKTELEQAQALLWQPKSKSAPKLVNVAISAIERRRHKHGYAAS